ncbi:MAG: hypothetical protein M5R36_21925 [Deltaproteobacteria bacterium]|nr:hypothetical protein [Deltaproteobacteria bacterium]
MRKLLVASLLISLASMLVVFASCAGDQLAQIHRPINDDEADYAKDRSQEESCEAVDLLLADCYDACNCCFDKESATHDELDQCVFHCSNLLYEINLASHPSKVDEDNYKECVVGCFSICDKPHKDETCWAECEHYLGN